MVIEWATNIINGIRTYSEDTEISLFGKILQNELEENCQLLIPNLKENINTIILNILRNEYPYKNEIELNKMKNDLIKSELPPEKIQQIVEALFDEKGKEVLFDKINKEINNKKAIVMKNSKINGKYSREEINKINAQKQNECNFIQYDFLLDICLEYQIKLHIKYLKPFLKLFQSIDEDRDGVLNEDQFIELVKNLNLFGEENIEQVIDEFLNNIDPYRNNHITFSDIVDLLSKINYDESQTILDKFCLKDISNNINNNNNNINNGNNNDNNINNNTNNEDNNEKNNSSSKKGIKKINEDIIK
jgi:Ca2+-binding EF-hand superfamily protein